MSSNIPYAKLSALQIKEYIKTKGNQDYLSWSKAWGLLKETFPEANRRVYECPTTGLNYFHDGRFGYVKVGVTIDSQEHIDYLPIMNFRNNSIPLADITSMDVNKTIQRSTTKAIAMHGLGLNLWTGEEDQETKVEAVSVQTVLNKKHKDWEIVISYIDENKALGADSIIARLEKKYKVSRGVADFLVNRMNSEDE